VLADPNTNVLRGVCVGMCVCVCGVCVRVCACVSVLSWGVAEPNTSALHAMCVCVGMRVQVGVCTVSSGVLQTQAQS